jgi:hypothetical protein
MSKTFERVLRLVEKQEVMISEHGYDEMEEESIFVRDIMAGVKDAVVVEDYPDYPKGPCALVLQKDRDGQPIHVVWGIPKEASTPAVVVTAYRPHHNLWSSDFLRIRR